MSNLRLDRKKLPCIINMDGTLKQNVKPANGTTFKSDELQRIVEGHIDLIHLYGNDEGLIMILNDDGKFTKNCNTLATLVAFNADAIYSGDYIAGNVLVCSPSDLIR